MSRREGAHGDLVLAVALACWLAGRQPGRAWLRVIDRLADLPPGAGWPFP